MLPVFNKKVMSEKNDAFLGNLPKNMKQRIKEGELFFKALRTGDTATVSAALTKTPALATTKIGAEHPILVACHEKQWACVNLLAQHGADVNLRTKIELDTPLMTASAAGALDTVTCLIAHDAKVNMRNLRNKSALIYASTHDIRLCLLKAGAMDKGSDADFFPQAKDGIKTAKSILINESVAKAQQGLTEPIRFKKIQLKVRGLQ